MKSTQKSKKINRQIVGLIVAIILGSLLIVSTLSSCFLGDYYIFEKRKDMKIIYDYLSEKCNEDALYGSENASEIEIFFDKYSVSCIITGADGEAVISSNADSTLLLNQLNYSLFSNDDSVSLISKNDRYEIFTQIFPWSDDEYLVLMGSLPNGDIVFVRSTVSAMEHTTAIFNKFIIHMVIVALVITILMAQFAISKFTKPLINLIDITKKISNFNFEVKYKPQRIYNEIDDLGEHINEMSTTLKRAITQLKAANDSLKHDLEVREETENMRKEFVSNVSHELKTPIALIQGYAEGLQEGIMDDENSRQIYLDIIIDEANKMNRLVREMLILNQLEAGQMNLDLVDFNVTEMIDSVVDSNQINFDAQNINYSFINKEDCVVHADEFLVEQVITNFISNAIHYVMNENIITVRYDFVKKGKVRISVFNSGNNIAKKDIKHIWEKFYKADKARSREYGGSGIGLSVVKATMELLHEKFGVENLSNGVEFWCELSLAKDTKINKNS
ncbi:MAG: HAMP domain-containing histidine kinase [Pseudobutyrivibrio sp.]|nr:HAMP domain-containing histidine kinase [Pseudobutyrivibrio sp.]